MSDALARGRDRYFRLLQLDVRVEARGYALADEIENRLALCQRGLCELELLEAAPELRVGARDAGREQQAHGIRIHLGRPDLPQRGIVGRAVAAPQIELVTETRGKLGLRVP